MNTLVDLTITDVSAQLSAGNISAKELALEHISRIRAIDPFFRAYIQIFQDQAIREAESSDARIKSGTRRGPLDGVPVAVKDNLDLEGSATTNGMSAYKQHRASRDATVVRRLRDAGAVILGKLNLHEAVLGATSANQFFGRVRHPIDPDYVVGGSSGGSAAAVAARMAMATLGTDTMGSVRIPASYCGVVGLKPTYGLVSTRGMVPTWWPLDTIGPIARSVEDAAIMLSAIAGYDPESPESGPAFEQSYWPLRRVQLAGLRFAVLRNLVDAVESHSILAEFARAIDVFQGLGVRVGEYTIDNYVPTIARRLGFLIVEAEAANTHGEVLAARPETLSDQVRSYMTYGRDVSSTRLLRAQREIAVLRHASRRMFEQLDIVLSPTAPQTAFRFDGEISNTSGDLTALANFAECPAITLPMGIDANGMPMGLQLMARPGHDSTLLSVAKAFESKTDFSLTMARVHRPTAEGGR